MSRLTLSLLGSACLARDGVPIHLRSRKATALLAHLAVMGGSHSRTKLATLFWPESNERQARDGLRYTLWLLRKALDGEWLAVDRRAIGLDVSQEPDIDVTRFRGLLAQCRSHGHPADETCRECLPLLAEAVDLYSGDLMAGFTLRDSPEFDEWQSLQTEVLRQELAGALEQLAQSHMVQGDFEPAMAYAQRWLALDPLHEPAHRCLMRLYAGCGQRASALRQYEVCQRLLQAELGVAPDPQTTALYQAIREGQEVVSQTTGAMSRHNLPPPPTPFVGRKTELFQIAGLLVDPNCRLLSVVGPGGIGKSRLAIRASRDQVQHFAHGVCFVPLGSVGSPEHLASAIMEALNVPPHGANDPKVRLVNALRHKKLLLILDSFEHLLGGAPLIAQMLGHAPGLKCLVTSRERLNLREEWLLPLEGLQFPSVEEIARAREEDYSAIQLFAQCARRVHHDFSLATAGVSSVARICQLVEGMPLAIELAAPWAQLMSCEDIARGIEQDLSFLNTTLRDMPLRHRSMRAVFDHSWGLLCTEENSVLRKLSVFRGGFRREAAESVAGASLEVLSALVGKSWLRAAPSGRYEMHELIRQYSAERLRAEEVRCGERVQNRHSRYFGVFLQKHEERLHGRGQAEAFGEILEDMDNVRAAWTWAVEHGDAETIGRYVETLAYAGRVRCWYREVMQAFDDAAMVLRQRLAHPTPAVRAAGREQTALVLADIQSRQALLCSWLGMWERATELCDKSFVLLQEVAPSTHRDSVQIYTKATLGSILYGRQDRAEAQELLRDALALVEEVGTPWIREYVLFSLGAHASTEGQYLQAQGFLERAIAIADETGEQPWKAHCLNRLSAVCWARGEYQQAQMLAEESLQIFRELGDQGGMGYGFVRLGEIATALGEHDLALQCYERSLAIAEEIGDAGMKIETFWGKGTLSLALGQHEQAKELFVESAAIAAREMEASMSYWPRSLTGLGHAALALGEAQEARKRFYEALARAMKAQRLHLVASAVMGLANLLSSEGHLQQAAEFATLILEHPVARQIDKDRAQDLLSELSSQLSPQALAAATAWGQTHELEMVAAEILSGHRNPHCTAAIAGPDVFKSPEPHELHGGGCRED